MNLVMIFAYLIEKVNFIYQKIAHCRQAVPPQTNPFSPLYIIRSEYMSHDPPIKYWWGKCPWGTWSWVRW